MQAERRNKPTSIAHRLLERLRTIEAPSTRYDRLLENIATSIERCHQTGEDFYIDTITCPLYKFTEGLGDFENFSVICGLGQDLEEEPRYLAKFQRYLATVAQANNFFRGLDKPIFVKGRVFFGDTGILGVDMLKGYLSAHSDDELRDCLSQNAQSYRDYFEENRQRLGLGNIELEFMNITDISPSLKKLPLSLYDLAVSSGIVTDETFVCINHQALAVQGVDEKIIGRAEHIAQQYALGRLQESRRLAMNIVRNTYLEIVGFLFSYGIVGKTLVQEKKTALFVTCDPPGCYRNDFYYTFLGKKGQELAMFTPDCIEKIKASGIF